MADFLDTIRRAMAAASASRVEGEEIAGVLRELSRQVLSASSGFATIELVTRTMPVSDGPLTINRLVAGEKYQALVLRHTTLREKLESIARWSQLNDGYPCQIVTNKMKYSCADKTSLEKVLMTIVADPKFGASLLEFMEFGMHHKAVDVEPAKKSLKSSSASLISEPRSGPQRETKTPAGEQQSSPRTIKTVATRKPK